MGCNYAKLKAEEEEVPEKIRPLLHRQYEGLKRLASIAKLRGNTLSQKILLKDDAEVDESPDSLHGKDDKVVKPCPNPEETGSREEEIVVRVAVEKLSKVVPLPDSAFKDEGNTEQEKKDKYQGYEEKNVDDKDHGPEELVKDVEDKDSEQEKAEDADDKVEVETEEEKNDEKVREEVDGKNKDEDEEEDDDSHGLSKLVCIMGSPSFRIYCQPQQNEEEKKSEDPLKSGPTPVHQKSLSADILQRTASANTYSSERKHQKGKFGAVKKLLKVKSCYYPSCTCTGGPDRGRLVAAKAVH